jgi:hypothetical protein
VSPSIPLGALHYRIGIGLVRGGTPVGRQLRARRSLSPCLK